MATVYIGIGSNLGEREKNIKEALRLLCEGKDIRLKKTSSLYETEPWGLKEQPWFINCAVEIETDLPPMELLRELKAIERILGRADATARWGPRTIDLDILLYDNMVVEGEDLKLPHMGMEKRPFVLIPLAEIAPHAWHPVVRKEIKDLLRELHQEGEVQRIT